MASLKEKTISSLLWKFTEQGGSAVASLVIQIVMARLLTPEDFGALAIMLVFINICTVLIQSGLNTALIQAHDATDNDFSTVFWLSISIAGILYIVIFGTAPFIADFYKAPNLIAPLRIITLTLFLNAFYSLQVAKVTKNLELKKTFLATILATLGSGAFGIIAALSGAGLWALVIQQLAFHLINCIVLFLQLRWLPTLIFMPARAKKLFGYSWKILASGLLDTAYNSLVSLIIGKISKTELGYVSQGEKYPLAISSLLDGTIQPVMLSAISHVQHDLESVKEITRRAIKTSSFLVVPSMGAIALTAEPLILVLIGEQWLPTVPFMQMFCFICALHPIHTSNLQAINGIGRSDLYLKIEITKKVIGVSIVCFAAFIIKDVYAIVGGMMVAGVVFTIVNSWPNKKLIHYSYLEQVKDFCPAFILTGISALFAFPFSYLSLPPLVLICLQCSVFAAVYIGLARFFKIETFEYLLNTMRERRKQD